MQLQKSYCFKLYSSKQNRYLSEQLFIASQIHNHFVQLHKRYYRRFKKYPSTYSLAVHLTKLKARAYPHWNKLGAQAAANVLERIDKTYKMFFRWVKSRSSARCAPPSFKSFKKYKSFTLRTIGNRGVGFKFLGGNKLRIGDKIFKFSNPREIEGKIKTLTVKRDALGEWYIFVSVIQEHEPHKVTTGKIAGFDFGLKTFLTVSDGGEIHSPLFALRASKDLRVASRKLSTKKDGSGNRQRAKLNRARLHRSVTNRRKAFHFGLAHELTTDYDALFFEDLNLNGMKKLWGRKVSDLGFYSFMQILEHKCNLTGTVLHKIGGLGLSFRGV